MIAKRVIFYGKIQGVGFRYAIKDLSKGFDICGWVKNSADGSVELQLMGAETEVAVLVHEIAVESNVAHHIKTFTSETIALLEDCRGFSIVRDTHGDQPI